MIFFESFIEKKTTKYIAILDFILYIVFFLINYFLMFIDK